MASRYRAVSKPLHSLLKSTVNKPKIKPKSATSLPSTSSSSAFSRSVLRLGCVQSLLPLHTAVSSARLTSRLGIDSRSSRSLSQEVGHSKPREQSTVRRWWFMDHSFLLVRSFSLSFEAVTI